MWKNKTKEKQSGLHIETKQFVQRSTQCLCYCAQMCEHDVFLLNIKMKSKEEMLS